jgi:hypothetical protein
MFYTLTVIQGEAIGRRGVLYGEGQLSVGRGASVTMSFPHDSKMSSRHFSLTLSSGVCRLTDEGSTNGTLVNGERVSTARLKPGDKILAGRTMFAFDGPPPAAIDLNKLISRACPWPYAQALQDEDPSVRRAALHAAAWQREPWLLVYLRDLASRNVRNQLRELELLAILAEPRDAEDLLAVGRQADLGPERFEILAAWGHPSVLAVLMPACFAGQEEESHAARKAWEQVTGQVFPGANPAAAERLLAAEGQRLSSGTRWAGGIDVSGEVSPQVLASLTVADLYRYRLRQRFGGKTPSVEPWATPLGS